MAVIMQSLAWYLVFLVYSSKLIGANSTSGPISSIHKASEFHYDPNALSRYTAVQIMPATQDVNRSDLLHLLLTLLALLWRSMGHTYRADQSYQYRDSMVPGSSLGIKILAKRSLEPEEIFYGTLHSTTACFGAGIGLTTSVSGFKIASRGPPLEFLANVTVRFDTRLATKDSLESPQENRTLGNLTTNATENAESNVTSLGDDFFRLYTRSLGRAVPQQILEATIMSAIVDIVWKQSPRARLADFYKPYDIVVFVYPPYKLELEFLHMDQESVRASYGDLEGVFREMILRSQIRTTPSTYEANAYLRTSASRRLHYPFLQLRFDVDEALKTGRSNDSSAIPINQGESLNLPLGVLNRDPETGSATS